MQNYVEGKVIVITGASSGFGYILAERVAGMGAKVVCASRTESKLKELVDKITSAGKQAEYIVTDVTDKAQVKRMVEFAVEKFGAVDVLVNNSGIMPLAFLSDHEKALDSWEVCIDTNIKGTLFGIAAAYDQMIKQGSGHVINVASIYGNHPVMGGAVYGATKAAIAFMTDAFRTETKGKINFTVIRPTGSNTNLVASVVNMEAVKGCMGNNYESAMLTTAEMQQGKVDPELVDAENIKYFALEPKYLVEGIIACINQPAGISYSDLTVRATGDPYVL